MKSIPSALALIALAGVAGVLPLRANHDVVAAFAEGGPDRSDLRLRFGQPRNYRYLDAKRMVQFSALSPDGRSLPLRGGLERDELDLVVKGAPAASPGTWAFFGFFDNAYSVQTAAGEWINTNEREFGGPTLRSVHFVKYFKLLVSAGAKAEGYDRVAGLPLELVPQANPYVLRVGDELPILVLYAGKPLAGIDLENRNLHLVIDAKKLILSRTNDRGIARVPILEAGPQLIVASYDLPCPDRDLARQLELDSTLSFAAK